jgi:hypothetical protein
MARKLARKARMLHLRTTKLADVVGDSRNMVIGPGERRKKANAAGFKIWLR